jgi:superfamily II DNA or RNA helicase
VDIATVQSLYRKGVVSDIVAKYGHLVVDECHHVSAVSFEQIARTCKARYVTGLSATVVRKDGRHPIIFMQCGPIRYKDNAKAQAAKRAFDHKVIVRFTEFQGTSLRDYEEEIGIQEVFATIVRDEHRNNLIVKDIESALVAGRSPLVLTERTEHLEILEARLRPLCPNLIVLRGGMGVRQRRELAAKIESVGVEERRILLGTGRYVGEGFDDSRLDTLFITMPVAWRGTIAQYAGRLHRAHERKIEVQIYDYADLGDRRLAKMHERRLAGYKALGYTIGTNDF